MVTILDMPQQQQGARTTALTLPTGLERAEAPGDAFAGRPIAKARTHRLQPRCVL